MKQSSGYNPLSFRSSDRRVDLTGSDVTTLYRERRFVLENKRTGLNFTVHANMLPCPETCIVRNMNASSTAQKLVFKEAAVSSEHLFTKLIYVPVLNTGLILIIRLSYIRCSWKKTKINLEVSMIKMSLCKNFSSAVLSIDFGQSKWVLILYFYKKKSFCTTLIAQVANIK